VERIVSTFFWLTFRASLKLSSNFLAHMLSLSSKLIFGSLFEPLFSILLSRTFTLLLQPTSIEGVFYFLRFLSSLHLWYYVQPGNCPAASTISLQPFSHEGAPCYYFSLVDFLKLAGSSCVAAPWPSIFATLLYMRGCLLLNVFFCFTSSLRGCYFDVSFLVNNPSFRHAANAVISFSLCHFVLACSF